MTARKVFSIIGLVISLFLIGNLFIPFYGSSYQSMNFWEINEQTFRGNSFNIVFLIVIIFAALIYVLQLCGVLKSTRFALFPIGFYLAIITVYFCLFANTESMEFSKASFWLGFIFGIVLLIITVIGNCLSNEKKQAAPVVSYDPQTGQPITQ